MTQLILTTGFKSTDPQVVLPTLPRFLGKVTVTNASTSTEDATLVSIVVQLQSSADGTVWSDVGSQVSVDFSSNPVLVPGESGIFDYQIPNFKPNQTDYFRVKDVVTTTKTTITSYTLTHQVRLHQHW